MAAKNSLSNKMLEYLEELVCDIFKDQSSSASGSFLERKALHHELEEYLTQQAILNETVTRQEEIDFGRLCEYIRNNLAADLREGLFSRGSTVNQAKETVIHECLKCETAGTALSQDRILRIAEEIFDLLYDFLYSRLERDSQFLTVQLNTAKIELLEAIEASSPKPDEPARSELDEFLEQLAEDTNSYDPDQNNYHFRSDSVGFFGREKEMGFLQKFCNDDRSRLWTAVIASGGSGKSRIGLELCREYKNDWHAVFVTGEQISELISLRNKPCSKDVLLVVDYLNGKSEAVSDLLDKWPKNSRHLRVLLLERERPKVDGISVGWFADLKKREKLHYRFDADEDGLLSLANLSSQVREIAESYADKTHQICLNSNQLDEIETALNKIDPELKRPLFTICITDAVCRNKSIHDWDKNDLLEDIYLHELSKITDKIQNPEHVDYVKSLLCFATMIGGLKDSEPEFAPKSVQKAFDKLDDDIDGIFHSINGTDEKTLHPLEPDILGEYFVLTFLKNKNSKNLNEWIQTSWKCEPKKFSTFLRRAVFDFGQESSSKEEFVFNELIWIKPENDEAFLDWAVLLFSTSFIDGLGWSRRKQGLSKLAVLYANHPSQKMAVEYAKGLVNLIYFDPDIEAKRGYFFDLRNLLKDYPCQDVAVDYAWGLVNMTNYDTGIEAKRGYLSDLRNLLKDYPCQDIAVIYAKGLFNMRNHDPGIEAKRGYISDLRNLLKDYPCQDIAVEYAKGLAIMICDDLDIEAKRGCLSVLRNLMDQYPSQDIAKMYLLGLFYM